MARLGIIGGTAVSHGSAQACLEQAGLVITSCEELSVETPWGEVPLTVVVGGDSPGHTILLLERHHGLDGNSTPPHRIEHRANMHALTSAGLDAIIAINNVGTLHEDWPPESIDAVDDVLYLGSDAWTFSEDHAVHVPMTRVLCTELRQLIRQELADTEVGRTLPEGTPQVYARATGPQFESPAEIRALQALGGTCVGMTFVPEVRLAAERQMRMAGIVIAGNWAAGLAPDADEHLDGDLVIADAKTASAPAWQAIVSLLDQL